MSKAFKMKDVLIMGTVHQCMTRHRVCGFMDTLVYLRKMSLVVYSTDIMTMVVSGVAFCFCLKQLRQFRSMKPHKRVEALQGVMGEMWRSWHDFMPR